MSTTIIKGSRANSTIAMQRKIVDYSKLTPEILNLLVEKFPDGYNESDIMTFRNAKNEVVEAVEIRTEDTVYLVKIGFRLVKAMEDFSEEDEDDIDSDDEDTDFDDMEDVDENEEDY